MISVQDLAVSFGSRAVLRGVSLEVAAGEIMAVMGSSGGGKTTLLKAIAGLLRPSAGKVTVGGIDPHLDPDRARREMGLVFQSAALFDYLNVSDNILFGVRRWSRLSREEEQKLLEELLEAVHLEGAEALLPSELSGGMRKRVGMARALALRPKVLLYDEPTTGLDPVTTYAIDQLIVEIRDRYQVAALVVSHDVTSVFRTADNVAFLHQGGLLFRGEVAAFRSSELGPIADLVQKSRTEHFVEKPGASN